ncbi:heparan-sulfate 6-O-sulfotransferase 3-B-like [Branchiostoma lanceolatum]|uniref:heparan-sulfate 6-O-sulfotransferase 3-B-like n=1 Tax=Branchiostoma lanceolatum TaxID=7740 RepID=UPI0034517325
MAEKQWLKASVGALLGLMVFGLMTYQYLCPGNSCVSRPDRYVTYGGGNSRPDYAGAVDRLLQEPRRKKYTFRPSTLDRDVDFNISENDVIVFLHMQKTGGTTFGRHLVKNMDLERPCQCRRGQKRCQCLRPGTDRDIWLFSRFSTGWSCGLHADWTELKDCVPDMMDKKEKQPKKRRYFYITMLREPVARYLSEWRHVQRGATWKTSRHMCDGKMPSEKELPSCFDDNWVGVGLDEFTDCPWNLANNRQTRMLADLSLVGCYNTSRVNQEQRNRILLGSAKTNLRRMAFFGLTEFQKKSQYMFERTFKLKFIESFEQVNGTTAGRTPISGDQKRKVEELNALDIELYDYAKDLFLQRLERLKQHDPDYYDYVDEEVANW